VREPENKSPEVEVETEKDLKEEGEGEVVVPVLKSDDLSDGDFE